MYTETTSYKQSNWIEIQGQQFNFDNVFTFYINKHFKKTLIIFEVSADSPLQFEFITAEKAQAEYDRIKTILGVNNGN